MIKIIISSWKEYLLSTLLLVMGTVYVLPTVATTWNVNIWSLGYVKTNLLERAENSGLAKLPPQAHQRASLWLARKYLELGNPQEAQVLVKSLVKDGNKDALIILGDSLAAGGDFSGAVQSWKQAGGYTTLIQAAWKAREEGRLDEAILAGEVGWELEPETGTLPLATFLIDGGELDSANSLLLRMVDEYPYAEHQQRWLLRLGDISCIQKSWEDAVTFYHQVLKEQPGSISARIGLGWVYYERGDDSEAALREFQLVVAQAPDRGEGYFGIAKVLAREKNYKEADAWFTKAIKYYPDDRNWWLARANNLRASDNLSDALFRYSETINRFPDWAPVYYEIAWAYRIDNNIDEAIHALESAMALEEPQNLWNYWIVGGIFELADKPEEALAAYSQALSLSPENKSFREAIERLTKTVP